MSSRSGSNGQLSELSLLHALAGAFDIGQRGGRLLAVDHDCPAPRVATSSATIEIAFGLVTMPMWLMPSMILTSTDGLMACTVSAYLFEIIISSSAPPKIVIGRVVAGRSTR